MICPFCSHAQSSLWLESSNALALWDGFPISETKADFFREEERVLQPWPGLFDDLAES